MEDSLIQSDPAVMMGKPDPAVMMGKPVIAGTRITVELILEKLSAGEALNRSTKRIRVSPGKGSGRRSPSPARALRADVVYPIVRRVS